MRNNLDTRRELPASGGVNGLSGADRVTNNADSTRLALMATLIVLAGGCATTKPDEVTVDKRSLTTAELTAADVKRLKEGAMDVREALRIVEILKERRDAWQGSADPVDRVHGNMLDEQLRQQFGLDFDVPTAINKLQQRVAELREGAKPGQPGNEVAAKNLAELEAKIAEVIGVKLGIEGDLTRVRAYLEDLKAKAAAGDKAAQQALDRLKDLTSMLEEKDSGSETQDGGDVVVEYEGRDTFVMRRAKDPKKWQVKGRLLYFDGKPVLRLPNNSNGRNLKQGTCFEVSRLNGTYRGVPCPN